MTHNYIHDCEGRGSAHVDIFQSFSDNGDTSYNQLFAYNLVVNFNGQMFMIDNTNSTRMDNIVIRNNVYINVAAAGQSYMPINYYNNTIINSGWSNSRVVMLRYDPDRRGDPSGSEIINNIFYNCGTRDNNGWYSMDEGVEATADYNLVYPTKSGFSESHGINGENPQFTNESNNDLSLQPTSTAIDSGTALSGFNDDYDGNPRPQGSAWDIGAYENGTGNPNPTPPSPPAPPEGLIILPQ